MERDILNRKITKKNGEKVPIRTLKPQEQLKYEIADELGLFEKIEKSFCIQEKTRFYAILCNFLIDKNVSI